MIRTEAVLCGPASGQKSGAAAVAQNGYALQYAAEDLRADKEVVYVAVAQNGDALRYAAEDVRRQGSGARRCGAERSRAGVRM